MHSMHTIQIIFTILVSVSLPEVFYLFLLCQLQHLYEYMLYGYGKDEKHQKTTLACKKKIAVLFIVNISAKFFFAKPWFVAFE